MESEHVGGADSAAPHAGEYIVVARRYRPQGFVDLVGQGMVSQALQNAINTDRVGHAYLFTGARGVGKTSTARILSKALNCASGPTPNPCNECDICQSIASGDDIDVLEIDGASNRGIDEIRQLRSNVSIRPSRSRFKIYIIDEVHMLTREAFNALLKTLEEPPEHVKFIFCTTAPEKIPITVLSRCQRFDFSPVETQAIVDRLQHIVESEGAEADTEALELLARQAAGSMRDSQSLLEQLLAFAGERITADTVHRMLGTAGTDQLQGVFDAVVQRDAAAALQQLDAALSEGVDAGQLAEQLLGGLRDLMAIAVGGDARLLLHTSESEFERLKAHSKQWGMETLLAAAQIMDQAIARMRQSTHSRILLETALVRIARLEDLDALPELIAQLRAGQALSPPPSASVKKKVPIDAIAADSPVEVAPRQESAVSSAAPSSRESSSKAPVEPVETEPIDAEALWKSTVSKLEGMSADCAAHYASVANFAPNRLVVTFAAMYNSSKSFCERPDRREELQQTLSETAGRPMRLEFVLREDEPHRVPRKPVISAHQLKREAAANPLVQHAMEIFSAEITNVIRDREDTPTRN